jgi:predicted dehydrogenase
MIGILGSGFGLYGYLPAAASVAQDPILLPARYKKNFANRLELQGFSNQICWIKSDEDLIKEASTLIISKRPKDQFELLDNLLNQRQITNIIFEKPFAQNPMQALQMQEGIQRSNKRCSVGFIFRHLPWAILQGNELRRQESLSPKIWELKWQFMAHHYEKDIHNWKRIHSDGGGIIRFYGIHLIALLAEWGYDKVNHSEVFARPQDGDYSKWHATFSGFGLSDFRVQIDSYNSSSSFYIKNNLDSAYLFKARDPFFDDYAVQSNNCIDPRCEYLKKVLIENSVQNDLWPDRFTRTIDLWRTVERSSKIIFRK